MYILFKFKGQFMARSSKGDLEYPPHPFRLHKALVSSFFAGGESEVELKALECLESLPPPSILAPDLVDGSRNEFFVPEVIPLREGRDKEDVDRLRITPTSFSSQGKARSFPMGSMNDNVMVFQWDVDPDEKIVSAISGMCSRISHLGTTKSLCLAYVFPGKFKDAPNWVPRSREDMTHGRSDQIMRIPWTGCLDELKEAFEKGSDVEACERLRYRLVQRRLPVHESGYVIIRVLEIDPPIDSTKSVPLCRRIRFGLMKAASGNAPVSVSGHEADGRPDQGNRDHVRYVPIISCAKRKSSGKINAVAVCMKSSSDVEVVDGLMTEWLGDEGHAVVEVLGDKIAVSDSEDELGGASRYQGWWAPSSCWVTSTPIVLDRYPKTQEEEVNLVKEAFVKSGFPRPFRVELSPFPILESLAPSSAYLSHNGNGFDPVKAASGKRLHVKAWFGESKDGKFEPLLVRGPIIVGRCRYAGLGSMIPCND